MPWLQARSGYSVTATRGGDSIAMAQPLEVTAVPHTTLRTGEGDVAMGGVSVAFATLLQQCRVATLALARECNCDEKSAEEIQSSTGKIGCHAADLS
jgi:hypothetical protein